ncbi:MAG: hypothetical protein P1U70_18585 [Saprospiraceae bacterium]|nr:hypothetical protein [Saprospiraceae bacterium]
MNGAIYNQSPLDQRLFISEDTQNSWCAYLLRMNENYNEDQLDFKTIWDGFRSTRHRGDFIFARKMPKNMGVEYAAKIRSILADKINVPYSIGLVWLLEPDEEPNETNLFVIPIWEQSTRQYQVAMESRFDIKNGNGEIAALKSVAAKKEINGNYSAIRLPTGSATGLTTSPNAIEFGLKLKNGELPMMRHTGQIVRDSYVSIPVSGAGAGCVRFEMTLQENEDLMSFDLGQKYFYQNGSFTELNFPILRSGRDSFEVSCQVSIDPANILNQKITSEGDHPQRTYLAFTGTTNYKNNPSVPNEETIFDSFFKSETGYNLRLKPNLESFHSEAESNDYFATKDSARLVFSEKQTNTNNLYFAPAGDFNLEYHPDGLPQDLENNRAQLLSGLSGTESIGFQPKKKEHDGDKIRFRPYCAAFAPDFPINEADPNGEIIEPSLTEHAHTSWINLIAENGSPVVFYAQSEGASLFAKKGNSDGEFLNFFEIGVKMPQDADFAIPLVPYSGVEPSNNLSDFGIQILSPIRKDKVADNAAPNPIDTTTIINVVTPQGTIAKLNSIGQWKEVTFAENSETADNELGPNYVNFDGSTGFISPEFRFGFVNLKTPLQRAFQTNQQFLVATDATNLGELFTNANLENLDDTSSIFNNKMFINDWPFLIKTGQNGNTSGAYRNVLICKFCQGTLYDRALNPALWTSPKDFNNQVQLNQISIWLKNYFDASLSQKDKYYEYFNKILVDPNWNGILALKVDLEADNFPDNLKGLLAGVDTSALNIHHFGIEINRVDTSGDLKISDNSSLFGLIDYQDATYRQQLQNANFPSGITLDEPVDITLPNMPVQDDGRDYDFRVLTLRVLFENSDIKDFASKIQVTLNKLMKDQVIKVKIDETGNIDGSSLQDPNDLAYSLILDGTYDERDGKSVYTFSSTKSNKFYLDSNIINYFEIERALFETLSSTDGNVDAVFRFGGNINFKVLQQTLEADSENTPASLDLFSFGSEIDNEDTDIGKGLSFSNLYLDMAFQMPDESNTLTAPTAPTFNMNHHDFSFSIQKSHARLESLFSKFPIDFQGFVFGSASRTPDSMGYLTVNTPNITLDGVSGEWFGFTYKVSLGTMGNLASSAGLEAKIMIAWSTSDSTTDTGYKAFLGIQLPGASGDSKMLSLQGLLKVAIDTIEMEYLPNPDTPENSAYVLRLNDIGFKFFNVAKLPLMSSTSFHLFANAKDAKSKNLGWLLAHSQEKELGILSLPLLAMGQRVSLDAGSFSNMDDAITKMQEAFFPPSGWDISLGNFMIGIEPEDEDDGLKINFNDESNWLIAFKFGLLGSLPKKETTSKKTTSTTSESTTPTEPDEKKEENLVMNDFAIELAVIFNDPDIYGARLSLGGDLVSVFDGLEFEILYKKITDSIGLYHIEFVLPSQFRSFKAGAASLTLPELVLDIFTNGDFKVDLGFPYDLDFGRSFSIEIQAGPFPIIGSGGFYFGKLSGDTAKGIPVPVSGKFDPVIVFGLGLEVGFGKSFEKGPLSASFKITIVGVVEGIVATYIPEQITASGGGSKNIENSHYYKIDGTFGIVGILEGAVDFVIIKASVYVRVYALVNAVFEAYKAVPLTLKAGVEVAVSVKIDVFIGTITIDFSFSAEIKETFTIGEDHIEDAPWYPVLPQALHARGIAMAAATSLDSTLKLHADPVPLDLYLTLQSTAGDGVPSLVSVLLVESPNIQDATATGTAFDNLANDVFEWVIRSFKTSEEEIVTKADLELATECLNSISFSQLDIETFLTNNYVIKIRKLEKEEDCANPTLFPLFPSLNLNTRADLETTTKDADDNVIKTKSKETLSIDFDQFSSATQEYLSSLNSYFSDPSTPDTNSDIPLDSDPSLAQWMFEDYFKIIAKHMIREALEITETDTTIDQLITYLADIRTTANLSGMIARYLMGGLRLPVLTGLKIEDDSIKSNEDYGLFRLTGQQFALPAIPASGTVFTGYAVKLSGTSTAFSLAKSDGTSAGNLEITYTPSKLTSLISGLNSGLSSKGFSKNISFLPAFETVSKRFKFKSFHPWTNSTTVNLRKADGTLADGTNPKVWYFSDGLLNHLFVNEATKKDFKLKVGTYNSTTDLIDYTEPSFRTYGTIIDLTIKRKASGQDFRYELIGTDEIGITLLERLLLSESFIDNSQVQIIYNENDGGDGQNEKALASRDINNIFTFINRVNLSTETNPAIAMAAAFARGISSLTPGILNDSADEFIRFIWESSILRTGGYYLFYQNDIGDAGLPDYIFNDDQTANLKILITHNSASQPSNFMNCALTESGFDDENSMIFLEANHLKHNVSLLRQSELGLLISRDNPKNPTTGSATYYQDYLTNLYHLLAFQVQNAADGSSDFSNGNMGVPVGPTQDLDMEDPNQNGKGRIPTDASTLNDWLYKLSVPLNQFAIQNPNVTQLGNEPNPYVGIGGTANLNFCWRDLFGNCALGDNGLFSLTNDIKLGYTDKLLPVSQWPNVGLLYEFEKKDAVRNLVIKLEYNAPDLTGKSTEDLSVYLTELKKTIAKIYYQISQSDGTSNHITANIASSFLSKNVVLTDHSNNPPDSDDNSEVSDSLDISRIQNFLKGIYAYLNDITTAFPVGAEIKVPINSTDINTNGLFELNVDLIFERNTALIHNDYVNSAEVEKAVSSIKPNLNITTELDEDGNPKLDNQGNPVKRNRLKDFAEHFETLFADEKLKIATGINKKDLNTSKKVNDIWVVNLTKISTKLEDNTVTPAITSKPVYYALKPLSTKLESHIVSVYGYDPSMSWLVKNSTEEDADPFTEIAFSEIDMDIWAQQFLEAVDNFLSPKMTTAAYLVDKIAGTSHLSNIMAAKDTLASSIVESLSPVFTENSTQNDAEAREKLRQQLLIKLNNAYLINTVVQFPITTSGFSYNGKSVRMYGKPVIQNDGKSGDRNFAFSTGKIDLNTTNEFLTFLFDTRHDEASPAVEFDLDYQITHLEFDIEKHTADALNGYESSSWLAFVCPENGLKKDLGRLEIPVVLRAYPTPLSLQSQIATQSDIEGEKSALLNATQWDYLFTYLQDVAAQDIVKAQVAFNLQPAQMARMMMMATRTLFDELATFTTLYPSVHQDLINNVNKISSISQLDDDGFMPFLNALDTFKNLVQNVATVWSSWEPNSSEAPNSTPLEGNIHYDFHIREDSEDNTGQGTLLIKVEPKGLTQNDELGLPVEPPTIALDIPNIEINDVKGTIVEDGESTLETRRYDGLNWEKSRSITERTIAVENLNILELQNVISQITLTRNENLVANKTTNDAFVYKTSMVKFPNKLVPLLDNRDEINIKEEVNSTDELWTVGEYLKAFFKKLLDKEKADTQTIKLECSYAYQIQEGSGLPEIKLPILMAPPTDFSLPSDYDLNDSSSFVSKLAANIQTWFDENQPADQNTNERFLFDVAVFSKIEASKMPIVRLRNVILNRDDVKR